MMSRLSGMRPGPRNAAAFLVFVILAFAVYAPALRGPFYLDDDAHIVKNQAVQVTKPSPAALWRAAWSGATANRPVAMLSIALDHLAHGLNPAGFRVTNIVLHALTALVLFLFLARTFALRPGLSDIGPAAAFLAALLWLCHPLETQAVSYIIQRMAVLAALFFLLTLHLYAGGRAAKSPARAAALFAGAAASFVLALGSKENTAVLPFFILLYEWYFFQDLSPRFITRRWPWIALAAAVFALTALLYSGFDLSGTLSSAYSVRDFSLSDRLLTQPRVILYYLSLFFLPLPSRLTLFHAFSTSSGLFSPPSTFLALLFVLALAVFALIAARRLRLLSFFILFFLGALAIESSAVGLELVFEHRLYLPSTALCAAVALFAFALFENPRKGAALLLALCLACGAATFARNRAWGDGPAFFADAVKKNPESSRAVSGLAYALMRAKRPAEALSVYQRAVAMDRAFIDSHLDYGKALAKHGLPLEAMHQFKTAFFAWDRYMENQNGEAGMLAATGQVDKALDLYGRILAQAPGHVLARLSRGSVLLATGKPLPAAMDFYRVLKNQPDNVTVLMLLGDALHAARRDGEAAEAFRRAARLDPHQPGVWERLAKVLPGGGRAAPNAPDEIEDPAVAEILGALTRSPGSAVLYARLGALYREKGRPEKAAGAFEKALALAPDSPGLWNNLGLAHLAMKNFPAARKAFDKALDLDPKNIPAA